MSNEQECVSVLLRNSSFIRCFARIGWRRRKDERFIETCLSHLLLIPIFLELR